MKQSDRRIINRKKDEDFTGVGYTSLNDLKEGESTDLIIPGKGAFIVKKIQGKFYHTRLYEGAPL